MIGCSMPGKMGDALYSLPTIKLLCQEWKMQADFYTSEYCEPLRRLVDYQSYIRAFIVPPAYKILRDDIGIQPWQMPIDSRLYDRVVHLGFRCVPHTNIPEFIARQVGAPYNKLDRIEYEYPDIETLDEPYICVSPRGKTTYFELFREVIIHSPVAVAVIGGPHDGVTAAERTTSDKPIIDLTGLDMLETVSWLSSCIGFIGLMSAMLVLANGFDMVKIIPHDGIHWDMRHVLYTPSHRYLILPNRNQVMAEMGL